MEIGQYKFKYPIIQAGMGVGITLSKMAIASSKNGVVPVVALVGTGYYLDDKVPKAEDFTSKESVFQILKDIRKEVGDAPVFCNIMCALEDYENIVSYAIEAGFNGIINGAGFQEDLPGYIEKYAGKGHNIAIIPIVNHKAFPLLMWKWKRKYKREIIPDAVILEGPKSGGHQGYSEEEINDPNFQLEVTAPKVLEQIEKTGHNIPLFVAGGIMYKEDIQYFLDIGCSGVQIGTRFLMTEESDASDTHKQMVIDCKEGDITIKKSPAGYPSRSITTQLHKNIANKTAPKIVCISNCLTNCEHGKVAKELGYCIANELGRAYKGDPNGLFFVGARGYELDKVITVEELVKELTTGLKIPEH